MLKNCHCILSLFFYFSLDITIRSLLGKEYFVGRTFDVAHYDVPPTSSLMVFTWHNTDHCKAVSVLSKIIHAARVCILHPVYSNNYLICSGQLCP